MDRVPGRGVLLAIAMLAAVLVAAPLATSLPAAFAGRAFAATADDNLQESSHALAKVIQRVLPAVVHISVEKTVATEQNLPDIFNDPFFQRFFGPQVPQMPQQEQRQRGLGSGFIVSQDGYILTNNHVAGEANKITVKLRDGRELDAKLVGADPATDLAVIKVDAKALPVAQFGDSRALEVGETVVAIGNPFGLEQTVTRGIVSAKGRSQLGLSDYEDYIQTDASINPGNSGGPLIDTTGKVVGVNSAIFSQSGGSMGIGFAIPSELAQHIMTALIEHGQVQRGYLGVSIQDVTSELADALGIPVHAGVLISGVEPGSAAAKAGIQQGDVITALNGQTVTAANDLRVRVADVAPGSSATLTVRRGERTLQMHVTLAERPAQQQVAQGGDKGGSPSAGTPEGKLGMTVQELTPQLAAQLHYEGQTGVLVSDVAQDSPAADAGLQRGALIQQVGGRAVGTVDALRTALGSAKPGHSVLLLVRLGNATRFVALATS